MSFDAKALSTFIRLEDDELRLIDVNLPSSVTGVNVISLELSDGVSSTFYSIELEIYGNFFGQKGKPKLVPEPQDLFMLGFGSAWVYNLGVPEGGLGDITVTVESKSRFLNYDPELRMFSMLKGDTTSENMGSHSLKITLTDSLGSEKQYDIIVIILDPKDVKATNESTPYFLYSLPSKAFAVEKFFLYSLPEAFDADGGNVRVEVLGGKASDFLKYDEASNSLFVERETTTYSDVGLYLIQIRLIDAETPRDTVGEYTFNLLVTETSEQAITINSKSQEMINWSAYFSTRAFENSSDDIVAFSTPEVEVSSSGILIIKFFPPLSQTSKEFFDVEEDLEVKLVRESVLEVIKDLDDENADKLYQPMTKTVLYYVISFTREELRLQLKFNNTQTISTSAKADQLDVDFRQEALLSEESQVVRRGPFT